MLTTLGPPRALFAEALAPAIENAFGAEVSTTEAIALPDGSYDSARDQYHLILAPAIDDQVRLFGPGALENLLGRPAHDDASADSPGTGERCRDAVGPLLERTLGVAFKRGESLDASGLRQQRLDNRHDRNPAVPQLSNPGRELESERSVS
jgi:hypothetical protein